MRHFVAAGMPTILGNPGVAWIPLGATFFSAFLPLLVCCLIVRQSGAGAPQMKVLEPQDVIALLRAEVERAGGQAAWASKASVSRIIVNKILNGHGLPTKKIIKALKLRPVFVREAQPARSKRRRAAEAQAQPRGDITSDS
jgi:hypothetical protein